MLLMKGLKVSNSSQADSMKVNKPKRLRLAGEITRWIPESYCALLPHCSFMTLRMRRFMSENCSLVYEVIAFVFSTKCFQQSMCLRRGDDIKIKQLRCWRMRDAEGHIMNNVTWTVTVRHSVLLSQRSNDSVIKCTMLTSSTTRRHFKACRAGDE